MIHIKNILNKPNTKAKEILHTSSYVKLHDNDAYEDKKKRSLNEEPLLLSKLLISYVVQLNS